MRNVIQGLVAAIAATTLLAPTSASASHDTPLYTAACEYREAVRDFERAVIRSDWYGSHHRRIVDRLEDATSGLRSYARHPHHYDRFVSRWHEVQLLQPQVYRVIFTHPHFCPTAGSHLVACWERVVCAYNDLQRQMAALDCVAPVPGYGYGRPALPIPSRPHYGVPGWNTPAAPFPQRPAPVPPVTVPNYKQPSTVPSYKQPSTVPSYKQPFIPGPVPTPPIEPRFGTPDLTHPSQWNPNRRPTRSWSRGEDYVPNWQLSQRSPRGYSPSVRQTERFERDYNRVVTRGGFDAATIGALISRLID